MPAPIKILTVHREALRKKLLKLSGISLTTHYACDDISTFYKNRYNIRISPSTFKRIFGIVKSSETASIYTLNQIVSILGFESWQVFVSKHQSPDSSTLKLLLIQDSVTANSYASPIDTNILSIFLNESEFAFQLYLLVEKLICNKESKSLDRVFKILSEKYSFILKDDLFFGLQPLSIYAERKNAFACEWVQKNISHSPLLKKYVFQGNVFDQELNSFYGNWLHSVQKDEEGDMPIFTSLLLCQYYFQRSELKTAKKYLDKAKMYIAEQSKFVSPILMGRLSAWEFILHNNEAIFEQCYLSEESQFSQMELAQFAAKLIWQYKDPSIIFSYLKMDNWESLPTCNTFYERGRTDVMKLVLALHANNQRNFKLSKKIAKSINPSYFHFSDRSWLFKKYKNLLHA